MRACPVAGLRRPLRGKFVAGAHQHVAQVALQDFNEVLRLQPRHTAALASRGAVQRALKSYDKAIADYDRALARGHRAQGALVGLLACSGCVH